MKALNKWFKNLLNNKLEFWLFPGHSGLFINEASDWLAGSTYPRASPAPSITSASWLTVHCSTAVLDWQSHLQAFLDRRHIHFKLKWESTVPQLWGNKGRQFIHTANNDMQLFTWFTRLASGHAPISSYHAKFFPSLNTKCPCSSGFQDVHHITVLCPLDHNKFLSFASFLFSFDNTKNQLFFLKQNTMVASFTGQPLDLDHPP